MIWAILAVLAAIIAAPFVVDLCRPAMNTAARRRAPGDFVMLSQGLTHYRGGQCLYESHAGSV